MSTTHSPGVPPLMAEMARTLGVDGILEAREVAAAAHRCAGCTDREDCREFLDVAAIRGAEHAPGFCRNHDLFDRLATEAPETF